MTLPGSPPRPAPGILPQQSLFGRAGGLAFLGGCAIAAALVGIAWTSIRISAPRGPQLTTFLGYFLTAGLSYAVVVWRLRVDRPPVPVIWTLALVMRLPLLLSPPVLSDDVFRYVWDGHLLNAGLNPYTLPVNSPLLDPYHIPLRSLVNHNWMATPYLPVAQLYFAAITRLFPQSPAAFQLGAVLCDLAAAWLLGNSLRRLAFPYANVLIYLWNPLVIIEAAHGAHVDALMLLLLVLCLWLVCIGLAAGAAAGRMNTLAALALAAATLIKGLPLLLAPLFLRRWGWKRLALYAVICLAAVALFAVGPSGAGWGLSGPLDGRGVFGAVRIYNRYWNYNSSLYHWLEIYLSGYPTPGAVPETAVGPVPILLARLFTTLGIGLFTLLGALLAWRLDDPRRDTPQVRTRTLFRLALLPLGAYLVLTHTVHPWYLLIVAPFLPFLPAAPGEHTTAGRWIWPWVYLSCAIPLSYLTYIDPDNLREFDFVRWLEYGPFYLLILWALFASRFDFRFRNSLFSRLGRLPSSSNPDDRDI